MRTTDLFKSNRSSKRLNETLEKTFGKKINFQSFDTPKLEDARNKLRTQLHQVRSESGFNENLENDAYTEAQWMHDAIVAELMNREEHIVDNTQLEGHRRSPEFEEFLHKVANSDDGHDMLYNAQNGKYGVEIELAVQNMYDEVAIDAHLHDDDDFEQILDLMMDQIEADYGDHGSDDEGGETDDSYALSSAGFGSDEDYESIEMERVRDPEDWDEGNTEPANNFAVYINGKKWKVFKGRGQYADDAREMAHYQQLKDWAAKKSESTGKKWTVSITGENPTESMEQESAPPTAKGERMVKHIKKGYAKDGELTDKEKSIAYATAWKQHNKESVETGDDMTRLQEGEIQQASAIVTAKTMVDRVGRWIEELSGMENDTLLQLGDSIRDEMGQEQAKGFIEAVAPAIQQALENLKSTREALASGVRTLTGEEQSAGMLGAEPAAGADEMGGEAGADMMNTAPEAGGEEDAFAAAEPAAGGAEEAGREQRESIQFQGRLLKVLAG